MKEEEFGRRGRESPMEGCRKEKNGRVSFGSVSGTGECPIRLAWLENFSSTEIALAQWAVSGPSWPCYRCNAEADSKKDQ